LKIKKFYKYLPLIFALFSFLVSLFHYNHGVEICDEGVLNMGALRISEGEVPYRDFFIPYTPFSFYFLSFFYKLFGANLLTGRVTAIFLSMVFILAIYFLTLKVVKEHLYATIPLAISCMAGFSMWHFASHHWLGDIFTIFSILFLIYFFENGKRITLILSGFLSGMTFITINDQGLYNIVFLFIIVFLYSKKEEKLKAIIHFSLGSLLPILVLFIYLFIKVPFSEIFYDLVNFPFTSYKQLEGNKMGIFYPFEEIIYVWKSGIFRNDIFYNIVATICTSTIAITPYLTIFCTLWFLLNKKLRDKVGMILIAGSFMMLLTAGRRWAPINLMWASSIPSIFLSFFLDRVSTNNKKFLKKIFFVISIFIISAFFLFGVLRIGNLFSDSKNIKIESRAGVLYLDKPLLASKLNGLLEAVEKIVPEDDYLFTRQIPLLNFLTKRKNPTRIDFFNPPIYSPKKQIDEVIQKLEETKTKYIATFEFKYDEKNSFDKYLVENYKLIWENKFFRLYKRKSP
jgi:hypothetical protein